MTVSGPGNQITEQSQTAADLCQKKFPRLMKKQIVWHKHISAYSYDNKSYMFILFLNNCISLLCKYHPVLTFYKILHA